ncbi:MAG: LAGLIDADG family homing endonuclease, partial [Paludibacter sp.]
REKSIHTKTAFEVNISSKILINDIISLGFGPNKTYKKLYLPNIPEELMRHFIRGYFDGDGSIIGSVSAPNIKNREVNYRITQSFQIDCKKKTLLEDIQDFVSNYSINLNINYITRDDLFRLVTSSKEEVNKLFHFLYDNSNFYLQRKFNKFNYYVNTEVSQIITDHRNA